MKIKVYQSAEKDNEIVRLNKTLVSSREELAQLSNTFEDLIKDIKNQLEINDCLRAFIYELQMKIENHNNQSIILDQVIKQQIENLARQSLQKKVIEYNTNNRAVIASQNEIETVKNKIGMIEAQNLSKSQIFSSGSYHNNPNLIKFGQMGREIRDFSEFSPQSSMHTTIFQTYPTSVPTVTLKIPIDVKSSIPPHNANVNDPNLGTGFHNTFSGLTHVQQEFSVSSSEQNVNNYNNQKRTSNEPIIKEINSLSKGKACLEINDK